MTSASRCCLSGLVLAVGLACSVTARAEQRSDVELAWLLESGDVLSGRPPAREPVWRRLAGRSSGGENLLRVGLSRADVGAGRGLTTLAHLRFELVPHGSLGATALRDLSSFLAVGWAWGQGQRLELRAFPFDTDYLRLGWLHALDWGGTDRARRESVFVQQQGGAPGAELVWSMPRLRVFVASKWATLAAEDGGRRLWGVLGGASLDVARSIRVEAGLGYFQRPGARNERGFVEGVSWRVVWHRGPREPELSAEPLRPAALRDETSAFTAPATPGAALALEVVTLVSRLRRFEDASQRVLSAAPAAGVSASWRGRVVALHGALTWRSVPFVVRDDSRVMADESLPQGAAQRAELAGWLGASLRAPFGLVAALELGVELPAALRGPSALPPWSQTFVVGGAAGLQPLPLGSGRLPVVSARASLRQPLSASLSASAWLDYVRDPNRAELVPSSSVVMRRFVAADQLGVGAAVQARF